MSNSESKDLVHQFVDDVVNGAHPELAREFVAPDFALYYPGEPGPVQGDDVPRFMSGLRTAFPDFFITIEDLIGEEERVAAVLTLTGTHRGQYGQLAPTNKAFKVPGLAFYRLRNGKIVEARPMFDRLAILEQLGFKPGPS
jgi:steroid delta-isomerase-like uncharacterized protein